MSRLLDGRVSFVTGGAQGIGLALAERFAQEGSRVMIGDIQGDKAETAADRLRGGGHEARAVTIDVTDPRSVEGAAGACAAELGEPDVLVANAGILLLQPVLEMSLESWRRVLDVNLTGVFLSCQTFARQMVAGGRGGRIIVTSSLFGRRGGRANGAYSATKFGVIGLVESLAAELAPHDILVNAVCPGQVATEMMRQVTTDLARVREMTAEAVEEELVRRIPLGRVGNPDEVGDVFVFLASPLSRYVTGQSIIVDGGWQVG
jgi:NAD(P)-dependent dehydrogenase (short-subunit alcohol dehydrogenase family)